MKPYAYRPLRPTREGRHLIRLFDILPGDKDAPICCAITHARLGVEYYETVSYCWGDATDRIPIRCDDGVLEITANLHAALRRLRRRKQLRRLWADAICINQADIEERNYQVSLMAAIYSRAQRVVIWLGEESVIDESQGAVDVAPIFTELSAIAKHKSDAGSDDYDGAELDTSKFQDSTVKDPLAKCVSRILQRPWFCRTWSVLELAVSAHAVLLVGSFVVTWNSFLEAAVFVSGHSDMKAAVSSPYVQPIFLLELARSAHISQVPQGLLLLLSRYRKFQATDSRDQVYVLLGLLRGPAAQQVELYVDYHSSTAELFKRVGIQILAQSKNLNLLGSVDNKDESDVATDTTIERLPSWVPDWALSNDTFPLTGRIGTGEYAHEYKASRGSIAYVAFSENGSELYLSGFVVDKVVTVGMEMIYPYGHSRDPTALWPTSESANTTQHNTHINWEAMSRARSKKRYQITGEEMIDVYFQTLVADTYDATESTRAHFEQWDEYSQWFRWIYDGGYDKYRAVSFVCTFFVWLFLFFRNILQATNPDYPLSRELAAKMVAATSYRRMIRTRNGFIGIAPRGVVKGDYIGVFQGGRVPLVIRSDQGSWKIVGESYVHGMMRGEVWNEKMCGTMRFK